MQGQKLLEREIEALTRECGSRVADRNCQVLSEVVRWTRQMGHGDVRISAVGHLLAKKLRIDSVITIGEKSEGSA